MRPVLLSLVVLSACRSNQSIDLSSMLARPGVTVRLGVAVKDASHEWARVALIGTSLHGRCPRLGSDFFATIDGQRGTVERGHDSRTLPGIEMIACADPSVSVSDLAPMTRGSLRRYVLEDDSGRFEVGLRLRSFSSDELHADPFPGPGGRWHFQWPGSTPSQAVVFGQWAHAEATDGGFDLILPPFLSTSPRGPAVSLTFERFDVEGCDAGRCESIKREHRDLDLDGGVLIERRRTGVLDTTLW